MKTTTVFYSMTGHSRSIAEGAGVVLNSQLYALTDRFTARPPQWKRAARRAVRGFDLGILGTPGVLFERADRLVLVFPYWGGCVVPAVTGFVRSVDLTGVTVFLVMVRGFSGGDDLIAQLEDDIIRQGGMVGGIYTVRTFARNQQRLTSLGGRIGRRIARVPGDVTVLSLAELLEGVMEDAMMLRDRYLQLAEITPDRHLKAKFGSFATSQVARLQRLQYLYRAYTGVVYEAKRRPIPPLKPEQIRNFSALLEGLDIVVRNEHEAFYRCQAIGERYPSQYDVVREMAHLSRSSLDSYKRLKRLYNRLSRHKSVR